MLFLELRTGAGSWIELLNLRAMPGADGGGLGGNTGGTESAGLVLRVHSATTVTFPDQEGESNATPLGMGSLVLPSKITAPAMR